MTFQKGESGNPHGKPKSEFKKDSLTMDKIRKRIHAELPDIIQSLVDKARDGDVQAARILLDRVCPPIKAQAAPISLPGESASLVEQGNSIIAATMQGEIPPDTGAQLITALSNQGKLVELEELSKRLARIEQTIGARP